MGISRPKFFFNFQNKITTEEGSWEQKDEEECTEMVEQQLLDSNMVIQGASVVQECSIEQTDRVEVAPSIERVYSVALEESCMTMTKSQLD